MNMPYKIRRAALADLREISLYTRKTWGSEQERIYMKGIFACFEKIAANQTNNRDLSRIVPGCLSYKISHHLIVFRWLDDRRPEIIRLLHEKMDVSLQLVG
jgi:toxin ParE1/3/4